MNLRQAITFCVLMQGNGGILTKAPSYVLEKLLSASMMSEPEVLLDSINLSIFRQYCEQWGVSPESLEEVEI